MEVVQIPDVGLVVAAIHLTRAVTGKDTNSARSTLVKALSSTVDEKRSKAAYVLRREHVMPGFSSDTPTWVVTFDDAMSLVCDVLPGKYTANIRQHIHRVFQRVQAGDQSVHAEVDANLARDGVVNVLARDGLGMQPVVDPLLPLKRRREELELLKMEQEIEGMRRQNIQANMDVLKELNQGELEARDRLWFADAIRNMQFGPRQLQLTDGAAVQQTTVSALYRELGYPEPCSSETLKAIGRLAARLYREANGGADPDSHAQLVDGAVRGVKSYMGSEGREIVQQAIETVMAASPEDARKRKQEQAAKEAEQKAREAAEKKAQEDSRKAEKAAAAAAKRAAAEKKKEEAAAKKTERDREKAERTQKQAEAAEARKAARESKKHAQLAGQCCMDAFVGLPA